MAQTLGPIVAATICVADLDSAVALYRGALSYEMADRGAVPDGLAQSWGAPTVAGRRYAVLRPHSGAPGWLRLIEAPPVPGYRPLASLGWSAIEILVADPGALAERLKAWPLTVIGPPAALRSFPEITAMQVIGPHGEVLYLTDVGAAAHSSDLPVVSGEVDRVFIVVLAVQDFQRALTFYGAHFAAEAGAPHERGIYFEGPGYGVPAPASPYRMTTMRLAGQSLIQLDEYSHDAPLRPAPPGGLPAGVAIASFAVRSLDDFVEQGLASAVTVKTPPYDGRRAITLRGPAGELIELVEAA